MSTDSVDHSIEPGKAETHNATEASVLGFDGSTFLQTWTAEVITGVFVILAVCVTACQVGEMK